MFHINLYIKCDLLKKYFSKEYIYIYIQGAHENMLNTANY